MSEESERIDVRGDGRIILYKREGLKNPKWQARIRVPNANSYKTATTKTTDVVKAQVFALNLYEELYFRVKAGGSVNSKTFKQVFDEWAKSVRQQGQTRQGGSWDSTIERVRSYGLEYFGAKRIDEIKTRDFAEYWDWRRSNFKRKPPSNASLKREKVCLVPVFKFARQRSYITTLPEIETASFKPRRRSTFTGAEWQTLYTQSAAWVREGEKRATQRDRFVAQQVFLILANTGMRVGELRSLRWSDLRTVNIQDSMQMVAWVKGKTGAREVVFQPGADEYVRRLYDLRIQEMGESPATENLVVCHRDGRAISSFKNSFKSLMEFAEIPLERNGMTRTIYSLRHFYATKRLENETSAFLLAKQMGTSVEMLEKFYGQTSVNASTIKSISRGEPLQISVHTKRYPFDS
jgi:integrase